MGYKPTVVFDFDGVIHSYASGWQGPGNTPDPVAPGISSSIKEIRDMGYKVVVVSTRCSTIEGMAAVSRYLDKNGIEVDGVLAEKPPGLGYIDDRAICFDGHPEKLPGKVKNFKTWLDGQERNDEAVERLRPCKATLYKKGEAKEVTGRFHLWGSNYEEFETGPGNFTTAIIELDDGCVVSCPAETVKFLDRAPVNVK